MNELNIERFGLEVTGRLQFSHPPGTHDHRLWAFALAVYYARLEPTEYHPPPQWEHQLGDIDPHLI